MFGVMTLCWQEQLMAGDLPPKKEPSYNVRLDRRLGWQVIVKMSQNRLILKKLLTILNYSTKIIPTKEYIN